MSLLAGDVEQLGVELTVLGWTDGIAQTDDEKMTDGACDRLSQGRTIQQDRGGQMQTTMQMQRRLAVAGGQMEMDLFRGCSSRLLSH